MITPEIPTMPALALSLRTKYTLTDLPDYGRIQQCIFIVQLSVKDGYAGERNQRVFF